MNDENWIIEPSQWKDYINAIQYSGPKPTPIKPKIWTINKADQSIIFECPANGQLYWYSFSNFLLTPEVFKNTFNLSQEEIDQIMKEIKQEQMGVDFAYSPLNSPPLKKEINGNLCIHEMVPYTGLNETFNHCKKCGQKEK